MDNGRVPSEPGSRASTEPVSAVSALPGFDPSRWGDLSCALANARYALEYWEREAIVWRKSVKEYDFTHGPLERGRREIATLREMDNLVRPIAYRCDSDGSPKGGDAQQGSVEDDSAVTQPIAQPDPARLERERVVAWLRNDAHEARISDCAAIADAIERGDHAIESGLHIPDGEGDGR